MQKDSRYLQIMFCKSTYLCFCLGPKLNQSIAKQFVKTNLLMYQSNFDKVAVETLTSLYLKNDSDWKSLLSDLSEFFADFFFVYPATKFADDAKSKAYGSN